MAQLTFSFDDSSVPRNRRASQPITDQLPLFAFAPNIDIHLHSPTEAVAQLSGSDPERAAAWLARVVGPTRRLAARRAGFPSATLDRLLAVRPPAHVTLDAATASVARALWAASLGLRPLRVTRHRQRLLASSVRWPTGMGVVDAPWPAIATMVALGIDLDIEPKARLLMTEKLSAAGTHIATAWLAGSAVMIETTRPDLIEAMQFPALAYAGDPETGRYRLPLLAGAALLAEPSIKVPPDLVAAIKRATVKVRPLSSLEGFPWELYPFQARDAATALRILETSGGVLLAGDMGSGKGNRITDHVQTPSGPRAFGDLAVGEQVLGADGHPHVVVGIYPQGEQDVYRVTFTDRTSIVVDGEHLWQVHTPTHKMRDAADALYPAGKVLSTLELIDSGVTYRAGTMENIRWYIPLIEAPLEFETPVPPLSGYVVGALLGDGSLSHGTIKLTDNEGEVVVHMTEDLEVGGFAGLRVTRDKRIGYAVTDPTQPGNRLSAELSHLGLMGTHAWTKFVPDEYKYAPTPVRLATLQGLLDTDGGVASHRAPSSIEFCSTSEQLADDVAWLAQSLGGTARKAGPRSTTYTYLGEKKIGRPSWRLSLAFPDTIQPFRCARKVAEYQPRTKYRPTRGIASIEPEGRAETICISVDSPDSLYVTEHAILTHNTTIALAVATQLELWPLLVVCPLAAMSTWARQLGEMGKSFYLATEKPSLSWATIERGEHEAIVISYDRLHAFTEVIEHAHFSAIIADELQRIRTPSSRRSRALRALAQTVPIRIGLSGTPLQNRLEDLLAPASFLVPGEFKPRATSKDLSDLYPGDPIESIAEHVGTLMVRRRMEDTGVSLPNKSVRRLYVDLSADQRHALATLESEAEEAKADGDLDRMHAFARLQKMRQIISCPGMADVPGPSVKVAAALELVQEFVDLGRKCVVFCANRRTWTDLADGLRAAHIGHTGIWGSTPLADRLANEQSFHHDPDVKVFLGTIQSCAESLTLSPTGTVVIHCDYVYNPSDLAQAEARVYRMNQTNPVDVIYLHASAPGGTLDDRMAEILEAKRALFAQVIDRTHHTDATEVSYSLGDLVYLLTGTRDEKMDAAEKLRKADTARELALKRHARVTAHAHKGKNKSSDDFFDDGSTAVLLEDLDGHIDAVDALAIVTERVDADQDLDVTVTLAPDDLFDDLDADADADDDDDPDAAFEG